MYNLEKQIVGKNGSDISQLRGTYKEVTTIPQIQSRVSADGEFL